MNPHGFVTPRAPLGEWEQLSVNEKAWIEFVRVISGGRDPAPSPERVKALRELLDVG